LTPATTTSFSFNIVTEQAKNAAQGLEELKKQFVVRPDGTVGFDQGIDLKEQHAPPK
jgi:hypothetical protein